MKKNLFILSLVFSAVLSINSALAAEEVVYYDTTSLDVIFEKYPYLNHKNKNAKKLEDKKPNKNESESPNGGLLTDSYHYKEDGSLAKGLIDTGENRRYFDKKTGQMVKNKKIENENIFVDADGEAHYIGWDYYKGKLGYYDPEKGYAKGLKTIDNITYGFDEDGSIFRKQNRVFDGVNFYFNNYGEATKTDGSYPKGWIGDKYYFDDGKPAEGLVTIDGKKYAFHERSLRLLKNVNKVFDHKMYRINEKGEAIYKYKVNHTYLSRGTGGEFEPGFSQNLMRKTPYFSQTDKRWAGKSYSVGTMANLGCGPTVMAMVLNRKLNTNDIYPTNTMAVASDYADWDGTDWQYFIEGVEAYGLKSYDIPVQKYAFIQALKDNPIVIRVGPGSFINAGHYMIVDSYKNGSFVINDPMNFRKTTLENIPWSRLRSEVTVAWEIK